MLDPQLELDIVYHLDQNNDWPDDSPRIHSAAGWVATKFNVARLTASISIVDDAAIHQLNRDELGHDWATDVISFEFERTNETIGLCIDGEVIASADTAQRLSSAAGWSSADELLLYVVHGLLHLVGLDDISAADRAGMRAAEQACLIALGVAGADEHLSRWDRVSY